MNRLWSLIVLLLTVGTALAEAAPVCPEIILKGNPTTGYSWTWMMDADKAIVEVEGGHMPAETEDGLVGAGGQYCFTLRGVTAGENIITFMYARPWETKEPLYTFHYHVCVDEDLNVTILGSSFDW